MVIFVVDKGLTVLRDEIDAVAPERSKESDGFVGDPDHASRVSDHNPEDTEDSSDGNDPDNQVDAGDFTHDPRHGADMHVIAEIIRKRRDRRVKYVIFNGRIFSSYATSTRKAWEWGPYSGTNDHSKHMHVSVVDSPNDYTAPWGVEEELGMPTIAEIEAAVIKGIHTALDQAANRSTPTGRQMGDDITVLVKHNAAALEAGEPPVDLPEVAVIRQVVREELTNPDVLALIADTVNDDARMRRETWA
jgi:hypothetical protein